MVFGSDFLFGTFCHNLVDNQLRYFESFVECFKCRILCLQLLSIVIDISEAAVDDNVLQGQLAVEARVLQGVEWDEMVWHNASSSIDSTLHSKGFEFQ